MRKFTTIFVAVVLCLAALTVFASAKNTNCTATSTGVHDWTAWKTVKVLEDGTTIKERTCACGRVETEEVDPPHKHSIAYVPAAEACHVPGCAEYWYCTDATCQLVFADEELTQVTNRKNLETPAVVELVYHDAVAACHANGYNEYWYCPKCDNYFADAAATQQTNIKNLTVEGDLAKLEHVAAVPACHNNGMQEYWYCAGCDCYFTDAEGKYNIAYLSLTVPGDLAKLEYVAAVPACHNNGMQEYWYCAGCDCYFTDAEGKYNIAYLSLTVPGDLSKLEYHAAVAPTATENGMNEYWYCAGCDCFFTDAEGKYNIAYLSLTIPATGETPANPGETPDNPGSPDTGDNAIFFIVALVAVATLGVAAVSFKKREN